MLKYIKSHVDHSSKHDNAGFITGGKSLIEENVQLVGTRGSIVTSVSSSGLIEVTVERVREFIYHYFLLPLN